MRSSCAVSAAVANVLHLKQTVRARRCAGSAAFDRMRRAGYQAEAPCPKPFTIIAPRERATAFRHVVQYVRAFISCHDLRAESRAGDWLRGRRLPPQHCVERG